MTQPIHFVISEDAFDLTLIPPDARAIGSPAFRNHVTKYLQKQYQSLGGETSVTFDGGTIAVTWIPSEIDADPNAAILELLQAGDYDQARPLLETLLQANPRDLDALYNLGVVASDQGKLDEARSLLRRATDVDPLHANSWVALGVAALRANDLQDARRTLEHAVEVDPENPFALRSLGTLYTLEGDRTEAAAILRRALSHAPNDPIILLTLAQTLIADDVQKYASEADQLLHRTLELAPRGEVAEKAQLALGKVASAVFHTATGGELRPDAVQYCLGALKRFKGMNRAKLAPIVMEMASLGQSGLPVNDPSRKFRLRLLPGEFTALHIVCMMHVGLKKIDPSMDSGFDINREYEAAKAIYTRDK